MKASKAMIAVLWHLNSGMLRLEEKEYSTSSIQILPQEG